MINNSNLDKNFGLMTKDQKSIPLTGVFADVKIVGKTAKIKIAQKFKNMDSSPIEAVYKFPLPENSAVTGFCLILDNKILRSEIEERDKAFKTYDEALLNGNGAVLLDQERPNIFTMSVGNLNPGSQATIEIEFLSSLDFKDNILRFFLPTTISPRYVPEDALYEEGIPTDKKVNPLYSSKVSYGLSLKVSILKNKGADVKAISSPSHKIKTSMENNFYLIEFTSESVEMDRDFVLEIEYQKENLNRVVYFKGKEESFIEIDFTPDFSALKLTDGKENVLVNRETIFVLDCSGSMAGSSIIQAKKSLEILVKALQQGQRFNIYKFGTSFEKFSENSLKFNDENSDAAIKFLENSNSDLGGTEILAPIKDIIYGRKIYSDDENAESHMANIVLITDGQVGNEQEIIDLVKSSKKYFRVFTVGIGFGPNEYFIKTMATSTNADFLMIHPEERIDLKIISLFKKINAPSVEDLKIDFGGKQENLEQAPFMPSVFQDNRCLIYARVKNNFPAEEVKLSGKYNQEEIKWNFALIKEDDAEAFSVISKLWAREKISDIERDSLILEGSKQKERKQKAASEMIVELSKKYKIISSKTSFVSIEDRSDGQKTTKESVLIKVPSLVTHGWHGMGANSMPKMILSTALNTESDEYYIDYYRVSNNKINTKEFKGPKQSTAEQLKEKILIEILASQKSGGGFELKDQLINLLNIDLSLLVKYAGKISTEKDIIADKEKITLLFTAIIVEMLEVNYKDLKDSWESVIIKSINWLNYAFDKYDPFIEKKSLKDFSKEYVLKMKSINI